MIWFNQVIASLDEMQYNIQIYKSNFIRMQYFLKYGDSQNNFDL